MQVKKSLFKDYLFFLNKFMTMYIVYYYSDNNNKYDNLENYIKNVSELAYHFTKRISKHEKPSDYTYKTEYVLTIDINQLRIPLLLKQFDNNFMGISKC